MLLLFGAPFCQGAVVWQQRELKLSARRGVDATVHGLFVFTNTGKKTVTIGAITTGCGCTELVPETSVVGPGQQGRLWAVFTVGSRHGPQVKTLTVATDDPASATTELTLQVEILEGKPDGSPTASR